MTEHRRLAALRAMLGGREDHRWPALSEREVLESARPFGQGVVGVPQRPPLNDARPRSLGRGGRADLHLQLPEYDPDD